MYHFKNTTPINGFDNTNLDNAKQNNYAWSMNELGSYIYVGTSRNLVYNSIKMISSEIITPTSITPNTVDNSPEIWRYNKNDSEKWKKVYTVPDSISITGLRFMINHTTSNGSTVLYTASYGGPVKVFKSNTGTDWRPLSDNILKGNSSRAMVSHEGKLYIATLDEGNPSIIPQLYSSIDPEFYPWVDVINANNSLFDSKKNPSGAISSMTVFNGKIYVATNHPEGVQVWRTNGSVPKLNDWTLIVDKGFGDSLNQFTLSIGTYKNHLYVSGIKKLPLAYLLPLGFDLIRIDKNDNWQLIVGGDPLIPSIPTKGYRNKSLSGLSSGFNTPLNVYAWQIREYNGKLLISTFDSSTLLTVIRDSFILNRESLEEKLGSSATNTLIAVYKSLVRILKKFRYPFGFDLYQSNDGIHFTPVFLDGIKNPYNYGGRTLFVDSSNTLYLGTANPFQGCEVWKVKYIYNNHYCGCNHNYSQSIKDYSNFNYDELFFYLTKVINYIPKECYSKLLNNYINFTNL